MSDQTERDPVHRARYAFEPDGENLWVYCQLEPGGALRPHRHPRQEERWQVVSGEVEFRLGDTRRSVREPDGVQTVLPGVVHGLRNRSDMEADLKCHVLPARGLQAFLTDSAAAAREGLFIRGGIPRSLRGARWAANFLAEHRDDVAMSFPPRFVQSALIALLADRDAKRSGLD